MFKGKVTELLSETLVQLGNGGGIPSAVQIGSTSSVSFTVWFPEMCVMTAGSSRTMYQRFILSKEQKFYYTVYYKGLYLCELLIKNSTFLEVFFENSMDSAPHRIQMYYSPADGMKI